MISEYIKDEFSNVRKSVDDYKYLKKKIKHSYFLDPWFKFNYTLQYKNISNQKKNISVIISNLKKISNQVSTEDTRKNIEKKSTEYCDFCCQSFSNILTHKCVFEKCQSCFRYLSNYKTIGCNVSNLCQNGHA